MRQLAEFLKTARASLAWSQGDLAGACGLTPDRVAELEGCDWARNFLRPGEGDALAMGLIAAHVECSAGSLAAMWTGAGREAGGCG